MKRPRIKGTLEPESYFVPDTKIIKSPLNASDQEIIDSLLLAIDNIVSGNLGSFVATNYVGQRLIELGEAMVNL